MNVLLSRSQIKKDVGKVDILINNAGIVSGKKLLSCPDGLMQKTVEVNTMAHFWVRTHNLSLRLLSHCNAHEPFSFNQTLKAFLPEMLESNHGHVVTIASAAGFFGVPGQVDYAARYEFYRVVINFVSWMFP